MAKWKFWKWKLLKWTVQMLPAEFDCLDCGTSGVGAIFKWQKINCPNCGKLLENKAKPTFEV